MSTPVTDFLRHHYRHFNAATLVDAADAYVSHLDRGGKMMVTVAGAMSTAELGLSLAEMIRAGKVHAITCTGANLEEDVFNLVAHDHYERIPNYRDLGPEDEKRLEDAGLNRVTDTCIPEEQAFRVIEKHLLELWQEADRSGERRFPHQFAYKLLLEKLTKADFQIDPKDSWLLAAAERNLPLRLIELMPMGPIADGWEQRYVSAERMRQLLQPVVAHWQPGKATHDAAHMWTATLRDGRTARVGFITPMSEHFCDACDRLRITAVGDIYPCLMDAPRGNLLDAVRQRDTAAIDRAIDHAYRDKADVHPPIAPGIMTHLGG